MKKRSAALDRLLRWIKLTHPVGFVFWTIVATVAANVVWAQIHRDPLPLPPSMNVDRKPISEWERSQQQYNDIVNQGGNLSLSEEGYRRQRTERRKGIPVHDPQGYIQPSTSMPENIFVCTKVLSHKTAIDYSFRLNNKFQVIHGDGDDRSIALKVIDWNNPNGRYVRPKTEDPNDHHIDRLNRFRLDVPLPVGKEFTSCLTIAAPPDRISKSVRTELRVFDQDGDLMNLGPMPTWEVDDPNQQNGFTQFSAGLIDARNEHPEVELRGYCAVEMKDYGDRPSDRERDACIRL